MYHNFGSSESNFKSVTSSESTHSVKRESVESPSNSTNNLTPKPNSSQTTVDVKMSPDSTSGPNKDSQFKVWTKEELSDLFFSIHQDLVNEKDSEPFRTPVNWELLEIPDYPMIIKNPMDLSTIKDKLENGLYKDPWEVVDDYWLMFNNAWLYNKKTSKVYKMCSTLAKIFESKIDSIMVSCGFCCGREFVYLPQVLICCTPNVCLVVRDAVYYAFQNDKSNGEKIISELSCDRYICCEKCYSDNVDEIPFLNAENSSATCKVKKNLLTKCRNNVKENEEFIYCRICNRKWHRVCANHSEDIWRDGYFCPKCISEKSIKLKLNMYKSKYLPHNELSKHIENRVNKFLKEVDPSVSEVVIRVLSSSDKTVDVKPGMKSHYCETFEMSESFKYRLKAIFAFQEIDGHEVCFFGLHVQEYGSDCPDPNSRRVYIAYLDSVHYFSPRKYRTDVYHEFLVGYLEYVKKLGYTMAHIWACPPGEGDDYIFHMHPPEQKLPKPKRLQEWYIKMLEKAMKENIVVDYKDIFSDALHSNMLSPTELPYFEGDYWPNALEEIFKEIDEEANRRNKTYSENSSNQEDEVSQKDVISKNNLSKMDKKPKKRKLKRMNTINNKRKRSVGSDSINDVSRRVLELMEKRKENFFVIRLHTQIDAAVLPQINDPDTLVNSDLMDGRDKFLCLAREKHLEFSSLRRAKFSTLCFCYELHMEQKHSVLYACNACNKQIEVRYTCRHCEDFELCPSCYATESHPHPLIKIDPEEENSSNNSQNSNQPTSELQDTTRARMVKYSQSLQHACQCRDVNCRINFCSKMKGMVKHTQCCSSPRNSCKVCQSFVRICFVHAKMCNDPKCQVPNCLALRFNWKQQGSQQRMQQAQMLRRRVALMQRGIHSDQSTTNSINVQTPSVDSNSMNKPTNSLLNTNDSYNNDFTKQKQMPSNISPPTTSFPVQTSQIENSIYSNNINICGLNVITQNHFTDQKTITDEDIQLVQQQYSQLSRSFTVREEFLKNFNDWLNTYPKYRAAFNFLRASKPRQNDMIINAGGPQQFQNVQPIRDTPLSAKPVYSAYSQAPQWESNSAPASSYQQNFTFHNTEQQPMYDYSNMKPSRLITNNPVYITSLPPQLPPAAQNSATISSHPVVADSMHHVNMIHQKLPPPYQSNPGFQLAAPPNYINNVQYIQQPHPNMPRFPTSMINAPKAAQIPSHRCLPMMQQHHQQQQAIHHDGNIVGGPNSSCAVATTINPKQQQSQPQQMPPSQFPPYFSQQQQSSQIDPSMNIINSSSIIQQQTGYGQMNGQVLINPTMNHSPLMAMHPGHHGVAQKPINPMLIPTNQ